MSPRPTLVRTPATLPAPTLVDVQTYKEIAGQLAAMQGALIDVEGLLEQFVARKPGAAGLALALRVLKHETERLDRFGNFLALTDVRATPELQTHAPYLAARAGSSGPGAGFVGLEAVAARLGRADA